jgi:hypothetical protein
MYHLVAIHDQYLSSAYDFKNQNPKAINIFFLGNRPQVAYSGAKYPLHKLTHSMKVHI